MLSKLKKLDKASSHKAACAEFWKPSWDGVVAGIAFDAEGLHLVQLWPDGEDPRYELIPWCDLKNLKPTWFAQTLITGVTEIWADEFQAGLPSTRQKQLMRFVNQMFKVFPQWGLRVMRLNSATSDKGVKQAGKVRASRRQSRHSKASWDGLSV
jgi:hypothetical protein